MAPFKAQNMSNHAAVTPDGGEIGRAQALQARAARVETDRRMNPILLKPANDSTSHLVVLGDELAPTDSAGYGPVARGLRATVLDALTSLRADHDFVVAEGAGGAAEINLFDRDLVNLPLAAAAGLPAVLVVDIDRGGAFAMAHGTLDLLPQRLRAPVRGIVINRIRGDASLLDPGLRELERRTGIPVLGVLPHLGREVMLGTEDSLDPAMDSPAAAGTDPLRVAAIRLPHLANPSDLDPLVLEPSVHLRWVATPGDLLDADLVIIPGSRATVADLAWMRRQGLDVALAATSAAVVGICAGYQMLGRTIADPLGIESGAGQVPGLGLLPVTTTYAAPKTVRRARGPGVDGYEIRWGRPVSDGMPWLELEVGPDGCISTDARVRGTSVHGIFDDDTFRWSLLAEVAAARGRAFVPAETGFRDAVDRHLDRLATWLRAHVDTEHLARIAGSAAPPHESPGW